MAACATTEMTSGKRDRSSDGSSSSTAPSPKRTVYDGESEVFSIPEDAPFWVPMLFKSMDSISQKVTDMTNLFDDYKNHIDKRINAFEESTIKRIDALEASLEDVKKSAANEKEASTKTISELKYKCQHLRNALVEHDRALDASEQYSRRNCVLLHGVKEEKDESTDDVSIRTIQQHLGVKIESYEIDRSHRIGAPRTGGKHRPIIVKFARYNVRSSVFRVKKKFKDTGILLTDSLTRKRVQILNEAREKYGNTNVWTMDGEIFTKIDNKKVNITYGPPASN